MRHAFLIIAHNEPEILAVLLRQLDAPDFDVFLHIDARATTMRERFSSYKPSLGRYFLLEHPLAVCWGDISQMDVEMRLFRAAMQQGRYAYCHLLSGVDLLLKSPQTLVAFLRNMPAVSSLASGIRRAMCGICDVRSIAITSSPATSKIKGHGRTA